MKRSNCHVALSLLAVFLSGTVVGAFAFRLYTVRTIEAAPPGTPEAYRKKYVNEMKARLNLDDSQTVRLNQILDQTRAKAAEVKLRYKPDLERIHGEQVQDIRTMLNVPQTQEYEKYLRERDVEQKTKDAAAQKH